VFVRSEEGHGDLRGHSFLEAGFGHCNPSPQRGREPRTASSILSLMRDLARERGMAVLCSLHQPNLARRYTDRVVGLAGSQLEPP